MFYRFTSFFIAMAMSAATGPDGSLTVRVKAARNSNGVVRVALWKQAAGFPLDPKRVVTGGTAELNNGVAVVTLQHIAPGTYAISSYHDENANGKLDTNVIGIPKEEYGFSNQARGRLGPPSFEQAKFTYDGRDETIEITLAN